jgi:hypothetical protein
MAKRNSTSEAPARCKDSAERDTATQGSPEGVEITAAQDLIRIIIDDERMRLMKAQSILQCVEIAMEAEQAFASDGPYWPSVIDSAIEIIGQSVRTLGNLDYSAFTMADRESS